MILLASSLKARLCVRTFVVCWLVSTVGRKEELVYEKKTIKVSSLHLFFL